jgi:hypothetical protein
MICLTCGHYSHPDGEMEREQRSGDCRCRCHPWNQRPCDCIASGNADKPKQHGADPHAKNCAVYVRL